MFELDNSKKYQQWTKDEVELLTLWLNENPSIRLSYTQADPSLSAMFPGRNATSLYSKVWSLRNHKTSIPKEKGCGQLKKPESSSKKHWIESEVDIINRWVVNNPGKKITVARMDSSLKAALPNRSLEAIAKYYRNRYSNYQSANDSNQAASVPEKSEENPTNQIIQPLSNADRAEIDKMLSFDVVEVLNSAIKKHLATVLYNHSLMKIEIAGLRYENAELIDELERQKKVNRMLSHLT